MTRRKWLYRERQQFNELSLEFYRIANDAPCFAPRRSRARASPRGRRRGAKSSAPGNSPRCTPRTPAAETTAECRNRCRRRRIRRQRHRSCPNRYRRRRHHHHHHRRRCHYYNYCCWRQWTAARKCRIRRLRRHRTAARPPHAPRPQRAGSSTWRCTPLHAQAAAQWRCAGLRQVPRLGSRVRLGLEGLRRRRLPQPPLHAPGGGQAARGGRWWPRAT